MENNIIMTPGFKRGIDLVASGQNVFITGKAGTGKSTLLGLLKQRLDGWGKNYAVCAPTGIAALNVGGQTIHSLFCLGAGHVLIKDLARQLANDELKMRGAIRQLEVLIVDEVSMVRADVLEGMNFILRAAKKSTKPFGGVQVILIGDPYQLPPVVTEDELEHFQQFHRSPHFFTTAAYDSANFTKLELTEVHRQHDQAFIDVLNKVRVGQLDNEGLALLNSRVQTTREWLPGTLFLTSTNYRANEINEKKMATLTGRPRVSKGWFEGDFKVGKTNAPAPEQLLIKEGAQVMLLKNHREGLYVNGTLGVVDSFPAEGGVNVRLANSVVTIYKEKWDTKAYEYNREERCIEEVITGSYTQYPLMPAWACTIHKSQGRTLDGAYINLGKGAFAAGQLYVALSRCRTLEGIRLERPVRHEDVIVDAQVTEFMASQGPTKFGQFDLQEKQA